MVIGDNDLMNEVGEIPKELESMFRFKETSYEDSIDSASELEDDVVEFDEQGTTQEPVSKVDYIHDEITEITMVALRYGNKTVGFRCKTNLGYFDVSFAKASEYGVPSFKIKKAINLQQCNGFLVSNSEIKNKRFVTDISNSPNDCDKIFKAIFDTMVLSE